MLDATTKTHICRDKSAVFDDLWYLFHLRSIYFVKDLQKGEVISKQHIKRIRPGHGLAPKYFEQLLGKRVRENVNRGTAVRWELIDEK